jgi:glycosyltransferase involved in cell wall biosynthesis
MKVLFIHQNFPGQFVHLAPALAAQGHEVHALRIERAARRVPWQGVQVHTYWPRGRSTQGIHPWVADIETKTLRGEACWRKARELAAAGFAPDVIYAHPGWGESLFLKQVWPAARLIVFGEFFYEPDGADMGFDPEFAADDPEAQRCRLQMKNLNHLAHLPQADAIVSPTRWQASRFPMPWRERIQVIHDGIDTDALRPDPAVRMQLANGLLLTRDDEVITFVARHLEPYRGFHTFMRALPALLRERARAQVVIVGEDGVSYGALPAGHRHWRERMLAEVGPQIDADAARRLHFVGRLAREAFTRVLQLSRVHIYLTYPFVLSWSLLEAMSVGAAIVASDTAPVREVIQHEREGLLVDFFDPPALVRAVARLLDDAGLRERLGVAARQTVVERYDLKQRCLPVHSQLVESVAAWRGDVQPPHEVPHVSP